MQRINIVNVDQNGNMVSQGSDIFPPLDVSPIICACAYGQSPEPLNLYLSVGNDDSSQPNEAEETVVLIGLALQSLICTEWRSRLQTLQHASLGEVWEGDRGWKSCSGRALVLDLTNHGQLNWSSRCASPRRLPPSAS